MQNQNLFPRIIKTTDLRYRWSQIAKKLAEDKRPILVMEHSTPKALIFSFEEAEENWFKDPLTVWRQKYSQQFSGWDATKAIRKARDSRWNLS